MNKVEIGLSVYPDFYPFSDIEKQLRLASGLGYTRVFTSIQLGNLGFERTKSSASDFASLFKLCRELGIKSHVDLNLEVFTDLGAEIDNLKPLADLNIDVLRLDGGFSVEETVRLTLNPYGIVIEDNPLMGIGPLNRAEAVKERGNLAQYRVCHNFFPRNETGLSFEDVSSISGKLLESGVHSGIFITSQSSPADLNASGNGVCTVEEHRYLPPEIAYSELRNTGVFDCILFGDSMPSYEDLKAVSEIAKKDYVELEVWLDQDLPEDQRKVLTETIHWSRPDQPALVIRSTLTRKKVDVPPYRCIQRPQYGLTVDNQRSNRYEGEFQICLNEMPPNPVCNVIGQLKPTCKRLLEQVKYMRYPFKIKE